MTRFELGIDYGTSNTVAFLRWPHGRVRPLMFDGSPLLSSAVYADPAGHLLVGRDALHSARLDPVRFEPNPKRHAHEHEILLGERSVPLVDMIAATLQRIADEAVRTAGAMPTAVTVTCPAAWAAVRRGVLVEAAVKAGLPRPALVQEPVAAAAYFASMLGQRFAVGQLIIVYDLGAGTFDVSAVRRTPDGFTIEIVDGLSDFGGLDLDDIVVKRVGTALAAGDPTAWLRLTAPDSAADQRHFLALWEDARGAKEMLSRQSSARLYVALLDRDAVVGREEFEAAAAPALRRATRLTLEVIRKADADQRDLAGVFLVGGSSRIPLVATALHRATGIAPTVLEQPELVVAEGALHAVRMAQAANRAPQVPSPWPWHSAAAPARPPEAASAPLVPTRHVRQWPVHSARRAGELWRPVMLGLTPLALTALLSFITVVPLAVSVQLFVSAAWWVSIVVAGPAGAVTFALRMRWFPRCGTSFIARQQGMWVAGTILVTLGVVATPAIWGVDVLYGYFTTFTSRREYLWPGNTAVQLIVVVGVCMVAPGILLLSITGRPRLTVDENGLTFQPDYMRVYQLQWVEIARTKVRLSDGGTLSMLLARPIRGSWTTTDPQLQHIWRPELNVFVMELGGMAGVDPHSVTAAISRWAPTLPGAPTSA